MTGADAKDFADAFGSFVETLFKIISAPGGMLVILLLALIGLGVWVYRLRGVLEAQFDEKCDGLAQRLDQCELRHKDCEDRERAHMLAIAMLHGVAKSIEAKLAGSVSIPSLSDIFSGRWTTAQQYNPEVARLEHPSTDAVRTDPSEHG